MHAGLFHTRNFAQMEGKTQFKSNSKQVPEDCCQRQNKATGTFLQVSSVQVYLIQRPHCSFFKYTSIQSAHTHTKTPSTHTLQHNVTHTHTHKLLLTSRGRKKNPLLWWLTLRRDGLTLSGCVFLQLKERNLKKWEDLRTYSFKANPHTDLQITHMLSCQYETLQILLSEETAKVHGLHWIM